MSGAQSTRRPSTGNVAVGARIQRVRWRGYFSRSGNSRHAVGNLSRATLRLCVLLAR